MYDVIAESDMSYCSSPTPPRRNYKEIFAAFRPGTTLGLSTASCSPPAGGQGLPEGHQRRRRVPQGHGPVGAAALRAGREVNGAGINASFAVQQDVSGKATDYALGWSVALGSPYTLRPRSNRSTAPTSSASVAFCWAPCTASPKASTAVCRPGHGQGRRLPQHLRVDHRADQQDHLALRPQGGL